MYVLKNAFNNILKVKGRNILIFILVFVIAVSACVALSIQTGAETAKQTTLDNMQITANLTVDRQGMMDMSMMSDPSSIDREAIMGQMGASMDIEELETYSTASSVSGYYLTGSVGMNTVDLEVYESTSSQGFGGMSGGMMDMGRMGNLGDFTLSGFSSHTGMTDFVDGTSTVIEGSVFDESDTESNVLISYELAFLNDIAVGDTISLANPSNTTEVIEFTVCGIYQNSLTDSSANTMFISYASLEKIAEDSQALGVTYIDERTGNETNAGLKLMPNATYVFTDVDNYNAFMAEAETMGLDTETYTLVSQDLTEYEQSILPLDNLSTFTMVFFIVVIAIGALILIIFNLFTMRERKYEIGVLAAIGMQKHKVALQFITEIMIVTLAAVIVGSAVGAVVSIPVGDMLLESQIASQETSSQSVNANFGGNFSAQMSMGGGGMSNPMSMMGGNTDYVDSITSNVNIIVILQLLGVGVLLSLIASSVAVVSILRYEPLKILSNRT